MVYIYVLTTIIHRINMSCMLVVHLGLCHVEVIMFPFGGLFWQSD